MRALASLDDRCTRLPRHHHQQRTKQHPNSAASFAASAAAAAGWMRRTTELTRSLSKEERSRTLAIPLPSFLPSLSPTGRGLRRSERSRRSPCPLSLPRRGGLAWSDSFGVASTLLGWIFDFQTGSNWCKQDVHFKYDFEMGFYVTVWRKI